MKTSIAFFCAILLSALSAPASATTCPLEGRGGDSIANRLQNRVEVPGSYQEIDIATFRNEFSPDLHTAVTRNQFTPAQIDYIAPREKRAIALTGYLLMAQRGPRSAANCNQLLRRNIVIWISTVPEIHPHQAKLLRAQSVVAELTPTGQAQHADWRLARLEKLARQGSQVRISGWAYYDASTRNALGKSQATLWEIHPVTRIEIWKNGGWKALIP
ncbi:MAG: hypothetical protein ACYDDO_11365 [Acidiferrobacterales bacterium]